MKRNLIISILQLTGGVAVFTVVDQLSKYILDNYLLEAHNFGIINLSRFHNYGISFGINLPTTLSLILIVLFITVLMVLYFSDQRPSIYYWGLLLCIAGGASNLFDRLNLGYVRDYVSIWYIPIFNLADIFILLGVVGLLIGIWRYDKGKTISINH